ncbi:MAG TPA: long-chain fatty acid--CoA ligase [Pseudonocardiaceae bacterium]|nr:long-chain fatty acid--CoA ligase [Pseudonocardiaceae bacterium]
MYLTQGLHRSVQQKPDGIATIFGDRIRTFAQQRERVARLAGALRGLGVAPGDRVAYLGLNSDCFVEYYLAVPWADAVVNPVNFRWSPAEISYSLADSQTRALLVDDTFAGLVPAIRQRYAGLDTVVHVGDGNPPQGMLGYEKLVAQGPAVDDARRSGDALAGLFYTGGTTGFPKGVMLSHANLITSALGALTTGAFGDGGRFLAAAPMFHMGGLIPILSAFITGGTHVAIPRFDPVAVMRAIECHRVTDTVLLPIMIQLLVDHPQCAEYDLSSLQRLVYGGSPISVAVLDRARKALPQTDFTQLYGQTELSPTATILMPADHDESGPHPGRLRSGGKAAPHAEVRIVDPEGQELPRGQIGEIACRGGHVMLGYWDKPEQTAAALRNGWVHTGDAGWMDEDGYVYVSDRLKDMIVTGGENVYSTEVENVVAAHPAVANCAVVAVPDDLWGERVHAIVVRKPGTEVTEEQIRDHTKTLIAGYKAPRTVEFVDELPATPTGKVLKRELRARYWAGAERGVN